MAKKNSKQSGLVKATSDQAVKTEEKQPDLAKIVQEASVKHGTAKSRSKATYNVRALDTYRHGDMCAANMEAGTYDKLCKKFDKTLLNYKEWAKQEVRYTDSNQSIKENLRSCNDGYTMSTIMDMLAPLQQGISLFSLAQIWMQGKVIQHVDPDFNMNVSRLTEHLRQDILDKKKSSSAIRNLCKGMDERLLGISVNNLETEITRSVKNATLDDIVMTPRQIAAIKLNFAEQCYADMRTVSTRGEMMNMRNQYDTAVEHLAAIAKNSGFDMSVVAAEERYLVGLKMMSNPDYGRIFLETCGLKAYPVFDGKDWTGEFKTYDGKPYTTGNSVSTGAFTPRVPYVVYDDTTSRGDVNEGNIPHHSRVELEDMLRNRAMFFAGAMYYLDGPDCEFNAEMTASIKTELQNQIKNYKRDIEAQFADDGLNIDWKKTFKEEYNTAFHTLEKGKGDIRHLNMYDGFVNEMKHNSNKKIIEDVLGETVPSIREANFATADANTQKESRLKWYAQVKGQIDRVADILHMEDEGSSYKSRTIRSDVRKGEDIINDARKDQLYNCDVKQATDLLMQSIVNMYQGYTSRESYERNGSLNFEGKRYRDGVAEVDSILNPRVNTSASVPRGTEFDDLFKDVTPEETPRL